MEFPLDFLYYLYNYYIVCALFSHTHHVTLWHPNSCDYELCNTCDVTLSCTSPCVISPKEKEKKRNIDNDLAILLSHNTIPLLSFLVLRIFTTCNKGQPYYSFCLHFLLSILLLLNLLAEFLLPSPQLFPRFFFSLLVLLSSISNFFLIFPSILHHIFYPSIQIISSLWTSLAIFLF